MKSRFFAILFAGSLGASSITAQSAAVAQLQRAKTKTVERINKFKECLTGKRPCSPGDIAAITVGILFIASALRTGRFLLPQPMFIMSKYGSSKIAPLKTFGQPEEKAKQFIKSVPYYIDPGYWGTRAATSAIEGTQAIRKKFSGQTEYQEVK